MRRVHKAFVDSTSRLRTLPPGGFLVPLAPRQESQVMTSLSPTPSFFTTTTSFATGTVAPTGSFFTTVTGVAAASSSPIYDSSTDDATALSDLLATYTSLISSLRIALGALVFGLVFASLYVVASSTAEMSCCTDPCLWRDAGRMGR